MDIAALSTALASAKIQAQAQVKVFKGANEQAEAVITTLLQGIAAPPPPANANGRLLDITA